MVFASQTWKLCSGPVVVILLVIGLDSERKHWEQLSMMTDWGLRPQRINLGMFLKCQVINLRIEMYSKMLL